MRKADFWRNEIDQLLSSKRVSASELLEMRAALQFHVAQIDAAIAAIDEARKARKARKA